MRRDLDITSRELASLQMSVPSSHLPPAVEERLLGVHVNDGSSPQADHQPLNLFLMKFRKVLHIEYAARRAVELDLWRKETIYTWWVSHRW